MIFVRSSFFVLIFDLEYLITINFITVFYEASTMDRMEGSIFIDLSLYSVLIGVVIEET